MKALVCLAQKLHKYFVKKMQNLLSFILLMALLPASAWAVSFSNLELTTTSLSVTIEGTISGDTPDYGNDFLFIVNPNESADPGFTIIDWAEATTKNFSGSPSLLVFMTFPDFDYLLVNFASQLQLGNPLEGTLVGSWSGNVFDPSAVTSLNFYWGYNGDGPTTGTLLGSASTSAVPDTGSTAALLGVGVAALAAARRKLG
jgi:hypothetical protein